MSTAKDSEKAKEVKEKQETNQESSEVLQAIPPVKETSTSEAKLSYAHSIMQKRKAVLDHAAQAYEQAVKKRINELGKICLECGLGDYDSSFLKEQFLQLVWSFPKRSSETQ